MLPLNVLIAASVLLCSGASGSGATVSKQSLFTSQRESTETCNVQAWVRAQDLSPNVMADGDLRIKINPFCKEKVAFVALQLQLDEFTEIKHIRKGATLPTPPQHDNRTSWLSATLLGMWGEDDDSKLYYKTLQDPALWVIGAEKRTAWKSFATLARGHFDYRRPFVVPFSVAVPNVNYPPGQDRSWTTYYKLDENIVTNGQNAYHYTATVTFENGHTVKVPAGFTTFHPMYTAPLPSRSLAVNVTFTQSRASAYLSLGDQCLCDTNDTAFTGQVIFDHGNVVRVGDTLKGRIMLSHVVRGPSTAEYVYSSIRSRQNNHWAQSQVASGESEDVNATLGDSYVPETIPQTYVSAISASSCRYAHLFEHSVCDRRRHGPNVVDWQPSKEQLYIPFEVDVTVEMIPNFPAFYVTFESSVELNLGIARPEFQRCLIRHPDDEEADVENVDLIEEGLWDPWVPVGKKRASRRSQVTHQLSAKIPITIVNTYTSECAAELPVHYLIPGAASPLVLAVPPTSLQTIIFPSSLPVVVPEPISKTTARMLSGQFETLSSDASRAYAGLLWNKKVAANLTDKGWTGVLRDQGKTQEFDDESNPLTS